MSFEVALRVSEVLVAIALLQRSIEDARLGQAVTLAHGVLCFLLIIGVTTAPVLALLWLLGLRHLLMFGGPYNGGADKMAMLVLSCLLLARIAPTYAIAELAFAYLAIQTILSYWISGWVKFRNANWRNGQALSDVFAFSAYPVDARFRDFAGAPWLLPASLGVILFELAFPLALLNQTALYAALVCAALFHLSNAIFLGLNRFFWIWPSAYPAVLWLQDRALTS